MKQIYLAFALIQAGMAACAGSALAAEDATVDRLYVLDCGRAHLPDKGRFISPGLNVGQPIDILNNCYLIQHGKDWLLWETGYSDELVGKTPPPGPIQTRMTVSLASQLKALGVKPTLIVLSHITHDDHTGNVDLFPDVPVIVQKVEADAAFAPGKKPPFSPKHPLRTIAGDHDVFGDGSVRTLLTDGHSIGTQSLLVHLKKTGYVILTGDAVQTQESWTEKWVTGDKEKGLAAFAKLEKIVNEKKAQIWANHDPLMGDQQRKERPYFE